MQDLRHQRNLATQQTLWMSMQHILPEAAAVGGCTSNKACNREQVRCLDSTSRQVQVPFSTLGVRCCLECPHACFIHCLVITSCFLLHPEFQAVTCEGVRTSNSPQQAPPVSGVGGVCRTADTQPSASVARLSIAWFSWKQY